MREVETGDHTRALACLGSTLPPEPPVKSGSLLPGLQAAAAGRFLRACVLSGSALKTWGLSADPWLALKTLHSRLRPSGHSPVSMPKCPAFSPYLPGIGYSVKTPNKTQSNNNKNLNNKELRSWTVRWDPGRGGSQLCGLGRVVHNLSPLLLLLATPPSTFFLDSRLSVFSFSQTFLGCVGLTSWLQGRAHDPGLANESSHHHLHRDWSRGGEVSFRTFFGNSGKGLFPLAWLS